MVVNLKSPSSDYFERTDTLVRYYEDIRKYDVMSVEEEVEMFELYKNGTEKEKEYARTRIINANQRFVVAVVKRFATNENILDLISEGNEGLIMAIDKFELDRGIRFTSWAVWFIRRSINMYCASYGSLIRKNNISKTYHVVSQATNKFIQNEYRKPTLEELSEILKEDYDVEIKNLDDLLETRITSIDEGYNSDDDNDMLYGDMSTYNAYSSTFNDYDKISNDDFNSNLISCLLNKLEEREKKIIKMYFGIGYAKSYVLQEIAEKENLTVERVRQIKNTVLAELKENSKKIIKNL